MKYRVGVDIGGTSIKAGIVDENFNIIKWDSVKTPDTFEKSMKAIADLVSGLAAEMGLDADSFSCVGVGSPGFVVPETGVLVFSGNTNWKNVPMRDELKKYISVPLYFGNDANCAIAGETVAGAAKGKKHVLMVTLGTGVGTGVIINGKLFAGGDGFGTEMGHTPFIFGGAKCGCGQKGCLEAYASATALIRQTKEALEKNPESKMSEWAKEHGEVNGQTAFDCAKEGDAAAIEVVEQYARYVAAGLGGFINTFRPELIIMGGGVSNAGDFLLDKIRSYLPEYTFASDIIGTADVQKAILGNDAGIIGAAYLDRM